MKICQRWQWTWKPSPAGPASCWPRWRTGSCTSWRYPAAPGGPPGRQRKPPPTKILEAVTSGMPEAVFTFHDHTELTVTGGRRLADADQNLLAAIGALVTEGQYLAEAIAVLDATDAACQRSADLQEAREGQRPSAWAV